MIPANLQPRDVSRWLQSLCAKVLLVATAVVHPLARANVKKGASPWVSQRVQPTKQRVRINQDNVNPGLTNPGLFFWGEFSPRGDNL